MKQEPLVCGLSWLLRKIVLLLVCCAGTSRAQSPTNIGGRTFELTVGTSSPGLAPVGSKYRFLPSEVDTTYDVVPILGNVSPSTGTYSYTKTGTTTATVSQNDFLFGAGTVICTFLSASHGNFSINSGVQTGTFTMVSAASPASIAGASIRISVTSGSAPFSSAGSSYWFLPNATGGYTIQAIQGNSSNSTGTYTYTKNGSYTGSVTFSEPAIPGGFSSKLFFDTATSGTVTLLNSTLTGYQTGTFTISFPANTAPTISNIANTATNEDTAAGPIGFTVNDTATPLSSLTLAATSSNTSLVPLSNIVFGGSNGSRTVTLTPALNQSGTTTITVTVTDGGNLTDSDSFVLTVNAVNDPPVISPIANQITASGVATTALPFTISDVETAAGSLSVTKASTNTALVPLNNIVLVAGANRTVTVTPVAGQSGISTITLTVSDGALTANTFFTLTVNAPPTISNIPDTVTSEDTATGPIPFTINDTLTPLASLSLSYTSTSPGLTSSIVFGGSNGSRNITVTPAANQSGSSTITVIVTDGGGATASESFLLTVNAVNDPPVVSAIEDQTTNVGVPTAALPFTISDVDSPPTSFSITTPHFSSNPALVPVSSIVVSGTGADRTVTVTPAPGQSGFSDIRITVSDGTATAFTEFRLNVVSSAAIPRGSAWKYLAPLTAAGVPANWKAAAFSDAAWSSGIAPIGFSPNGEDGETTVIPTAAGKPFTVYFRKTVFVSDPLSSPWLQLNLRRDDGAVVYLNGTELWRSNMTETGTVAYDTPARISLFGPREITPVSRVVPGTALVPGDNVFAVEVHQIGAGSSDLGFDLEVIPLNYAPPVIARGDDWKYLAPSSAAGAPPSNWKSLAFSDAAWSSGIGVFGYGGDGEVTALPTASGNPFTAYFRKKITVADVSRTKGLRLNLRRDDGAVVYLNGVEKWRSNMPEGVGISHTTPARAVTGGVNETTWFTRDVTTAGLLEGENVIAVAVHQNDAASSDLGFDLELLPLNYTPNPPPWISDVSDRTLAPGANTGAIGLMVGDAEPSAGSLVVNAVSSNPAVILPAGISFGGSGSSRTVTVTAPPAGQPGSSLIRLTVSDGTSQTETAFVVTVTPAASSLKLAAWGSNGYGQLGNNSTSPSASPLSIALPGALASKTPVQVAAGDNHSLVLFSDGTLAAWGRNTDGQLGMGDFGIRYVPTAVPMAGALAGKQVVAITAGRDSSVALCLDGTVASWGDNSQFQLGNDNGTSDSAVPVSVYGGGVLSGKTVIATAAGYYHCLALLSDGTIASWGHNYYGQLGNGGTTISGVPVAVALNKSVASIAAAGYHSIALCNDGTLAVWGDNTYGQIGNNTETPSAVPLAVNSFGVLAGGSVAAVGGGYGHTLAVLSDGRMAAWGWNNSGQLGDGFTGDRRRTPVFVSNSGVLAGRIVRSAAGGLYSSAAICTDGTAAEWGENNRVPVPINLSGVLAGRSVFSVAAGASFKLGLTSPPAAPFKVTTMHHIAAGDVFIGFPTLEGVPYRIEWSDSLNAWANWGTVNGIGGELITRLPGYGAIPRRFFRVSVDQ